MIKRILLVLTFIFGWSLVSCIPKSSSQKDIPTIKSLSRSTELTNEKGIITELPQQLPTAKILVTQTTLAPYKLEKNREPTQTLPLSTPNSDNYEVIYIQDRYNAGTYFYAYPDLRGAKDYLKSDQIIAGPGKNSPGSGTLSFANFDSRIAYTDLENNIWISDLKNQNPFKIYSPENNTEQNAQITWTPDDKHVIIDFNEKANPNMIYHLDNNQIEDWRYECDRLAISPHTVKIAIWCSSTVPNKGFAIIEWGGEIWYSIKPPEKELLQTTSLKEADYQFRLFPLYRNVGWSSDGKLIAFFNPDDKTGALQIATNNGEVGEQIPQKAYWLSDLYKVKIELPGNPIQWSRTGDRLLLFSIGDMQNPCKSIRIEVGDLQGEYSNPGCWQVYDVKTKKTVWTYAKLTSNNGDDLGLIQGGAALSKDGERIALDSFSYPWGSQLIVLEVDQNEILQEAPFAVEKMRWGPLN